MPFSKLVGGVWLCPDLPGHGPNPQLDCSPCATVKFVERLLAKQESASNGNRRALLGYSMGARIALQYIIAHPENWDALILISPQPGIEYESKRQERQLSDTNLSKKIHLHGVEEFIKNWQKRKIIHTQQSIYPSWRSSMITARKEHTSYGLANSLRQFGQASCPNIWPSLKHILVPTLLISGKNDTKYTKIVKKMVSSMTELAKLKQLLHVNIEQAGHAPHLEAPINTSKVISDFLDQHIKN